MGGSPGWETGGWGDTRVLDTDRMVLRKCHVTGSGGVQAAGAALSPLTEVFSNEDDTPPVSQMRAGGRELSCALGA